MSDNPLNGISTYKDTLNLATGDVTRTIKKLVLTGSESNWQNNIAFSNGYAYFNSSITTDYMAQIEGICSHMTATTDLQATEGVYYGNNINFITNTNMGLDSTYKWQQYLSEQYANGTPVILCYVMTSPETDTISVPTGLTGTVNGYLTQSGTPTPTNPIYPTANNVTMWANYTPNKYNGAAWQAATGQPEQYNSSWT